MSCSFPLLYFKKLLIVMSFPLILFFNSSNTHWTLLEVAHSMSVIQPSKENRFFFFFLSGNGEILVMSLVFVLNSLQWNRASFQVRDHKGNYAYRGCPAIGIHAHSSTDFLKDPGDRGF